MDFSALIDGDHRYHLFRRWALALPSALFIMLNPSTADASEDDPTVRKCIGFARRWGCGSLDVLNLFTYRATDPKALRAADFPNGPMADAVMRSTLAAKRPSVVVYGWGRHGPPDRVAAVDAMVREAGLQPVALKVNKDGSPRHPLYIPYATTPVPWSLSPF